MAMRNPYFERYSDRRNGGQLTQKPFSSSSSSTEDRDKAEYLKRAEEEYLRTKEAKDRFEQLLSRVFAVVVGVDRRRADGLPLDMKEEDYMKTQFNDDARNDVIQYDGASSIVLSPVAPSGRLGGISAVYPAGMATTEVGAPLLVSDNRPFGVTAVFDFDVKTQKTASSLRIDYNNIFDEIKKTMLNDKVPEFSDYSADEGTTKDAARWPTFFPQHSSIGLHLRPNGGLSIIVNVNVGNEGIVTLDKIMSEEGMTFGRLVVDPRYVRLERLVERNARRLAYEVAERLWGFGKVPFEDDSFSCLKDYHCYYPLAVPSIVMHTNCLRLDRLGNVVVFVDAANRMTTRSPTGVYLGLDKNVHNHGLVEIPDDDSLFVLHAKKLTQEERPTRNTDAQELRASMFKYAYVRGADVHIKRKHAIPSYETVYENIISIKK